MKKNLYRSAMAVAVVCACVALPAPPASASVSATTPFALGTLTINKTGQPSIAIPLTAGGSFCGSDSDMVFDVSAPSATSQNGTGPVLIAAFTVSSRFLRGTTHYVAVITRTSSSTGTGLDLHTGTLTDTITTLGLTLQIEIYVASNTSSTATDCATTGTPVCTWNPTLSLSGTFTGTSSNPVVTNFMILSSTASTPLIGVCGFPFSAYALGTSTITNLGPVITSIP